MGISGLDDVVEAVSAMGGAGLGILLWDGLGVYGVVKDQEDGMDG